MIDNVDSIRIGIERGPRTDVTLLGGPDHLVSYSQSAEQWLLRRGDTFSGSLYLLVRRASSHGTITTNYAEVFQLFQDGDAWKRDRSRGEQDA